MRTLSVLIAAAASPLLASVSPASPTAVGDGSSAPPITVRAWIDGRSRLILDDDTAQWQHFDFAAPGRLDCISGAPVQPTHVSGVEWFPDWPDVPDCENRNCGGCTSSSLTGLLSPIGNFEATYHLTPLHVRGMATIVEQPTAANGFRLVVEFDDNPIGAADWYEVELMASPCFAQSYCLSVPNSSGNAAGITAAGTFSVVANDTQLQAAGCPPQTLGLFFYGPNPSQLPVTHGYFCVSPLHPGFIRVGAPLLTSLTGSASAVLDMSALPPEGAILAGSTWYFQFWFRDAGASGAYGLTDGVRVTFCP